ncbi:hypothetical protein [Clostridium sp. JN-9]|uniref:hypothetical protein n=1 Tax=Clostridium sp. JN-9 TaxID=2507159 RepID=UPI000FFE2F9A|nr:hypothetical protein [Clostridium sp. JN-9]QAT39748.1 hypothetical protein EQM05_05500 [Clostridium sp. JN-9]
MRTNLITIIAVIINFTLLIALIIVIYKAIQGFKNFINKNKEMDKKLDIILNKLKDEEDK